MNTTKTSKDGTFKMDAQAKEFMEDFSQKADETRKESAKAAEEGDLSSTILELYNKQFQFVTDFYTNLLNQNNSKTKTWGYIRVLIIMI